MTTKNILIMGGVALLVIYALSQKQKKTQTPQTLQYGGYNTEWLRDPEIAIDPTKPIYVA